jgi:hypothetical protein
MGSSSIEYLTQKMKLLGACEGISDNLETNLVNHSKNIGRVCVATLALIISPDDLDNVTCLLCGNCPKVVNSDGNAKDSIKIRKNMIFDYEDESDPPSLEEFKLELVKTSLRQSFYQREPQRTYNMLKIPLIISQSLLSKQVNNDFKERKTIYFLGGHRPPLCLTLCVCVCLDSFGFKA